MLLRRAKDTGEPVNSFEALRYLWINWRIIGIHPPQSYRCLYMLYSICIHTVSGICMDVSLLLSIYYTYSLQELFDKLPLNLSGLLCSYKHLIVLYYRRMLHNGNVYLQLLDARSNIYSEERLQILKAIRICHMFYAFYMVFYGIWCSGFDAFGYSKGVLPFGDWCPQIFNDPQVRYLACFSFQSWSILTFLLYQNVTTDIYPSCYLVLMAAHMRTLSVRISRIGTNPNITVHENTLELVQCIKDHKNILSYFDCIRPAISGTIFIQFIFTGIVICLTAVNLILLEHNIDESIFMVAYIFAILSEIFPCCWYVNALAHENNALTEAMYNCLWYEQDEKFRKILIIFMQRSQRTIVIMAGNIVPITLQTFLTIIRFTFSMYTILSKLKF